MEAYHIRHLFAYQEKTLLAAANVEQRKRFNWDKRRLSVVDYYGWVVW